MIIFKRAPVLYFFTLACVFPGFVDACGAFFCRQQQPVNQAAEQIIFVHDEDATNVTAVVQIMYQGPSEKFAWLLPVPGVPEVGVSSNIAFQNLRQSTDPQFIIQREIVGECKEEPFILFDGGDFVTVAVPESEAESTNSKVNVEVEGSVGPYDYVVISVEATMGEAADAAIDWLIDNGYDVFSASRDLLGPYLEDGMNLLAFRLTKGNEAGAIRPVVMTYNSTKPMIPIRPTAVAAEDDMGILVWVVAESQAIPTNYYSLKLNEALINWFNPASNYVEVVTKAADQANGKGFVTELAAESSRYSEAIFSSFAKQQWESFNASQFKSSSDALSQAFNSYGTWDGFREAAVAAVTFLDPDLTVDNLVSDFFTNQNSFEVKDIDLFKSELHKNVIKPVNDTQALLVSQPYLTRFYTTMSADEMTEDPIFDVTNGQGLADVSNIHTATQVFTCNSTVFLSEADWSLQLPNGNAVNCTDGCNQNWPILPGELPANVQVSKMSTSGEPEVVLDHSEEISQALDTGVFNFTNGFGITETDANPSEDSPDSGEDSPDDDDENTTSSAAHASVQSAVAFVLVGVCMLLAPLC